MKNTVDYPSQIQNDQDVNHEIELVDEQLEGVHGGEIVIAAVLIGAAAVGAAAGYAVAMMDD